MSFDPQMSCIRRRCVTCSFSRFLTRLYHWQLAELCRGGDWKTGGSCHLETLPELGSQLPQKEWAQFLDPFRNLTVLKRLHNPVAYINILNVTQMTSQRRDGHLSLYYLGPSEPAPVHRQDCSHWCLPGVPDIWNELLYVFFLRWQHRQSFSIHQNTSRMNWASMHRMLDLQLFNDHSLWESLSWFCTGCSGSYSPLWRHGCYNRIAGYKNSLLREAQPHNLLTTSNVDYMEQAKQSGMHINWEFLSVYSVEL